MANFNIPLMRNCFSCCDLRSGVLILAISELCIEVYGMFNGAKELHNLGSHENSVRVGDKVLIDSNNKTSAKEEGVSEAATLAGLIVSCVGILITVLLIVCAALNKPKFRLLSLVWIAWKIMTIFLLIIALVLYSIAGSHIIHHLVSLASIAVYIFFIYVVSSYYALLKSIGRAGNFQVFYNSPTDNTSNRQIHNAATDFGEPPPYETTTMENSKS